MRTIGASARLMLIEATAQHWNTTADQIRTRESYLTGPENQRASYGTFAKAASLLTVPDSVPLKKTKDFRLIGKHVKRVDTSAKVDGSAVFGMDVQQPDMLIEAIAHAPVFAGELQSSDKAVALAVSGVVAVLPVKHGIAVLASDYWTAHKGLLALKAVFNSADVPLIDSKSIMSLLQSRLDEEGKSSLSTEKASVLDLEYSVPFLAHATMEPMNCTAHVQTNRCDIWAPTQGQTMTAETAAEITGLDKENIFVHTTYLGGGFGRRGETDFVAEAVSLSKTLKKPVKVIWSREQDIQHDYYRPACVSRFQFF